MLRFDVKLKARILSHSIIDMYNDDFISIALQTKLNVFIELRSNKGRTLKNFAWNVKY